MVISGMPSLSYSWSVLGMIWFFGGVGLYFVLWVLCYQSLVYNFFYSPFLVVMDPSA